MLLSRPGSPSPRAREARGNAEQLTRRIVHDTCSKVRTISRRTLGAARSTRVATGTSPRPRRPPRHFQAGAARSSSLTTVSVRRRSKAPRDPTPDGAAGSCRRTPPSHHRARAGLAQRLSALATSRAERPPRGGHSHAAHWVDRAVDAQRPLVHLARIAGRAGLHGARHEATIDHGGSPRLPVAGPLRRAEAAHRVFAGMCRAGGSRRARLRQRPGAGGSRPQPQRPGARRRNTAASGGRVRFNEKGRP